MATRIFAAAASLLFLVGCAATPDPTDRSATVTLYTPDRVAYEAHHESDRAIALRRSLPAWAYRSAAHPANRVVFDMSRVGITAEGVRHYRYSVAAVDPSATAPRTDVTGDAFIKPGEAFEVVVPHAADGRIRVLIGSRDAAPTPTPAGGPRR